MICQSYIIKFNPYEYRIRRNATFDSSEIESSEKTAIPTKRFLALSAFLVMSATIISRILGLAREMAIANVFGASGKTDAYNLAYNIPEMVRTLVISGVLSSIFIPIFADFREKKSFEDAKRVTTELFSFTTLISVCTCVVGIILAPQVIDLAQLISFGKVAPETYKYAVDLTRVLFPMLIFVALSGLIQGILNSMHDYRTPAFAPFIFNITVIGTVLGFKLADPGFQNIYILSFSVVIADLLQMLVQIPAIKRFGFTLLKIPDFKHEAFVKFWELAPAAMLGYATMVINSFVDKSVAFGLIERGVTTLSIGFRVQQLPYSVFGVTIATVMFPSIAQDIAAGRLKEVRRSLDGGIRMLAFTIVPSSVFFMVLSEIVIEVLFGHGAFKDSPNAVLWAGEALAYYTLGILPASILLFLSRVFFSFHDTKTPLKAGAFMVLLNYGLDQVLGREYGVKGISMATSIVAYINCAILIFLLRKRLPGIWVAFINKHLLKILFAGVIQYFALAWILTKFHARIPNPSLKENIVLIVGTMVISVIVFCGITIILRSREWFNIWEYLIKRKSKIIDG